MVCPNGKVTCAGVCYLDDGDGAELGVVEGLPVVPGEPAAVVGTRRLHGKMLTELRIQRL